MVKSKPKSKSDPSKKKSRSKVKTNSSNIANRATAEGFAKAAQIKKKSDADRETRMKVPFDFWLPVGKSGKVMILDKEPHFMYEHRWKGSDGKWNESEICIKDGGLCPLCQSGKFNGEGYYVMLLSIIDFRKYKNRDGKTVKMNKKLLRVKVSMIPKFQRLFKNQGAGKSFRGLMINLIRDNQKSSSIGDDLEFLKKVTNKKLNKLKKDLSEAIDYSDVFKYPTEKQLRKKYELDDAPGEEDMDDEDDEDLDEADWDEDDKKKKKDDDDDDEIPF